MGSQIGIAALLGASVALFAGCGSSGTVDFYDGSAGAGRGGAGSSGAPTSAGAPAASAGQPAAGSNSGPDDLPCGPVKEGVDKMTGPFGTVGAVCIRVKDDIVGWGCSNFEGRTVKVNGTAVECAQLPLPEKLKGDYYFDVSAGEHDYASFYWF